MKLPGFPVSRPRRLRTSPALRQLVAETSLDAAQLVLPLLPATANACAGRWSHARRVSVIAR